MSTVVEGLDDLRALLVKALNGHTLTPDEGWAALRGWDALADQVAADHKLWIEVASEHRHASERPWCEICARIIRAREALGVRRD